jgi:hypothetical protein
MMWSLGILLRGMLALCLFGYSVRPQELGLGTVSKTTVITVSTRHERHEHDIDRDTLLWRQHELVSIV